MADSGPINDSPFQFDRLEVMCKNKTKVAYQSLKANYKTWRVDQKQKLQAEREQLEDELRQLRKRFADMELADLKATAELKQLLSRPWTNLDGSPDFEELFAEAHKRNTELCRIKANHERPGEDKKTIMREMEKLQIELEDLAAEYVLVRKEETQRLGEKLEQLWQRQNQPIYSASRIRDNSTQRQNEFMTGRSMLATQEMVLCSALDHERRRKRSREASIEVTSAIEFNKLAFLRHPDPCSLPEQPRIRRDAPSLDPTSVSTQNTGRTSRLPLTNAPRKVSKPSPVIFRNQQGRYKTERARPGRTWITPKGNRSQGSAQTPISFLPDTHAKGRRIETKYAGSNNPESTKDWLDSTRQTQDDNDTRATASIRSERCELPNQHGRAKKVSGKQPTRYCSQVSAPDSDPDLPILKKQKVEKATRVDEKTIAEKKDWRRGEKAYRNMKSPPRRNRKQ